MKDAFAASTQHWSDEYRVSDFNTVMRALRLQAEQNTLNFETRKHIFQYMVSSAPMAQLFASARALEQFGGQPVPDFVWMEDALEAARTAIKNRSVVTEQR